MMSAKDEQTANCAGNRMNFLGLPFSINACDSDNPVINSERFVNPKKSPLV